MKTRFTQAFGVAVPVVQGGLAHLAHWELCAAVSAAGGLGQLTALTMASPEELREEVRQVRARTDRPFALNFALGRRDVDPYLQVAVDEAVPAISLTAGNPAPIFEALRGVKIKKIVLTAGVRQAQKCEELGADAVIAVGYEGGGHLGRDDIGGLVLIPRIVRSVSLPVLASGGIAGGAQLAAALAMGAEGIEMGTRFVATLECRAHAHYKQALVAGRETDTAIIERSLGRPGRALRSPITDACIAAEAGGASEAELHPFFSGEANKRAALAGELEQGFVWASQGMGLIDDVPTVAELLQRILHECAEAASRVQVTLAD
ncbi:MAG: NAD(P)H-dependent flavin oxidoreductase [Chloroflexota bacterium]